MTDKWKDRIIRGGFMVVAPLGLTGAVIGMAGYAAGEPPVLRAGAVILVTAALIGAACVAAVQFPDRRPRKRRGRRGNT